MDGFAGLVGATAFLAGTIASVASFGIGSLLTPLLALRLGMHLAVAAVSVPHLAGTLLRFWQLKGQVDRRVFFSFGLMSAAGGLTGALLHGWISSGTLTLILGALLIFAGVMGLLGLTERLRFRGAAAWLAGAASGVFGGLVGNQGGIRSAALLGFGLSREAFVATATAIGLIIDGARMPIYLGTQLDELFEVWPLVAVATAGVLLGTIVGRSTLRRVPEPVFRTIVSSLLLVLGIGLLVEVLEWR
jgi:uncharacterized membrane protein YfcA